jgi:hypothetical protein
MKRIVASVGLIALGASALQTASGQAIGSPDTTKPWSIAATLRGFYDDNPGTVPNDVSIPNRGSFGFEVSPSAALTWALEQTTINIGFLYSFKYYDTKPPGSAEHDDQTFSFSGEIKHQFSERVKAAVSDSFVIGQEPDVLRAGNTFSTFQRLSGDNIRNFGSVSLDTQVTRTFGLGFGYDNSFYDYKDKDPKLGGPDEFGNPVIVPSNAGALNRIEQRAHLEGSFLIQPETKLLLGYQFSSYNYTGDELIGGEVTPFGIANAVVSNDRNNREHTFYVGAEHAFTPELTGSIRAGASYTDYYNDPFSNPNWTPYVNASMRYAYAPRSSVEFGFSYDRAATSVVGVDASAGTFVLDSEAAVVFASVVHSLTPQLFANIIGQFQNTMYNGGLYDGMSEQYYLFGLDLEYRFTPFFSGHVGYNYDRLQSHEVALVGNRTYDRNRVYIGITASY